MSLTDTGSEEPLMQLGDSDGHASPAAGEDQALFMIPKLTDPKAPNGPKGIEIQGQPQPLIDAPRVEGGEQFGGPDIKETRGGHEIHHLIGTVERLRLEMEAELKKENDALRLNFRIFADARETGQVQAVRRFAHRLLEALAGP